MEYYFKESTNKPESFFNALPQDWQEGIVPYWTAYEDTARIFVFETGQEVIGGGSVFSTISPDTQPSYQRDAQRWFDEGYLYIGFLWISEKHRDKKLGSNWLQSVFTILPRQKFWLSIEEYALSSFYLRNGFELIERIDLAESQEWILAMKCPIQERMMRPVNTLEKKAVLAGAVASYKTYHE